MKGSGDMRLIASQPYIKIERIVSSLEQKDIEHQRTVYLYEDRITTRHREFPMKDVLSVSQKRIGSIGGLLYIHTASGLFSYTIQTPADAFIQAFEQINHCT